MVNNINSGFEEIFTKHNLSDEKILSILKFLTNSQLNIKKINLKYYNYYYFS